MEVGSYTRYPNETQSFLYRTPLNDEYYKQKNRADNLEILLEKACGELPHGSIEKHPELHKWWVEKCIVNDMKSKEEALKVHKEELRKQALSKLSVEERKALGI